MELTEVSPGFYTAGQIRLEDLDTLAERGLRSVINNRPDHEATDQPTNAVLEARARSLGLGWRYAPIRTREPSAAELAAFRNAVAELEGPVCAFCRTGTRSTIGLGALGISK